MCSPSLYTLRPARLNDAKGVARTHQHSWQAAYAEIMPSEVIDARSLTERTAQWRQWLIDQPEQSLWIAEKEGKVLGFVAGGPTRGVWAERCPGEIYALYLHPVAFGQGIGSRLFKTMKAHLEAEGYATQWVWVLTSNTRARCFYEKMGGVYQTTNTLAIGDPPHSFEEVAYLFSDKS